MTSSSDRHIMRNIDGDDPKLWAEHTGDLIRVKSEFACYAVPPNGDPPDPSDIKHRTRLLVSRGEVLMFLGQIIHTGDWYAFGVDPEEDCLVFLSLKSNQKIALPLRDLNVYRVEEIKE